MTERHQQCGLGLTVTEKGCLTRLSPLAQGRWLGRDTAPGWMDTGLALKQSWVASGHPPAQSAEGVSLQPVERYPWVANVPAKDGLPVAQSIDRSRAPFMGSQVAYRQVFWNGTMYGMTPEKPSGCREGPASDSHVVNRKPQYPAISG